MKCIGGLLFDVLLLFVIRIVTLAWQHHGAYPSCGVPSPGSPSPQQAQPSLQRPLVVVPGRVRLGVALDAVHAQRQLLLVYTPQQCFPPFGTAASLNDLVLPPAVPPPISLPDTARSAPYSIDLYSCPAQKVRVT